MVLSPERLVASLNLTRTSRVLEIGPGPGFFSIQVAQAVPDGRLELVDIQMEMLLKARGRLRRASLENVGYVHANAVKLPFRACAFDVAFLVAVLGEVADPKGCLASVADALRPGGLLSVAELPGDPDALTEQQLRTLAHGTCLQFIETKRVSRTVLATFRRASRRSSASGG